MKKITSDQLFVSVSFNSFIKADRLTMYHAQTGETKPYSEIEESDLENWVVEDASQLIRNSEHTENTEIDISAAN